MFYHYISSNTIRQHTQQAAWHRGCTKENSKWAGRAAGCFFNESFMGRLVNTTLNAAWLINTRCLRFGIVSRGCGFKHKTLHIKKSLFHPVAHMAWHFPKINVVSSLFLQRLKPSGKVGKGWVLSIVSVEFRKTNQWLFTNYFSKWQRDYFCHYSDQH